jgi:hypothetical protein
MYPCHVMADSRVRAPESEPASNWPLPTISMHVPCPEGRILSLRTVFDQKSVVICYC